MFFGSIPALITPFRDGALDEATFCDFVEWQISQGSNALVPVGTTGESPTLDHDEHKRVVELCIKANKGRVPVIAGAGSNSTAEAIDLASHAKSAGADAVLVVVPYYNRPTQEGMYQHFKAVAEEGGLPTFIYNVPSRSAADISVATMARLAKLPNIVGTKDATANLQRPSEQRLACGEDFIQLSGEDGTSLGFNAHGGVGCISVTANVAPALCAEFQATCLAKDYKKALEIQDKLLPLHVAMFVESSPGPVKYACSLLGQGDGSMRLPMVPVSEQTKTTVRAAMVHAGLLNG